MPIVVLDPGHGGTDTGAVGNGLEEKNLTLSIALKTAAFLRQVGVDVRLTRSTDVFVSLSQRAAFANSIGADLFVSIHINAGGGSGFESYVYSGGVDSFTVNARNTVHQKVAAYFASFGLPDRGEKSADFAVLRETNMAAMLLENGFIDNPKDAALLKNDSFLNGLALSIATGITTIFNLPAPGTTPSPRQISKYFVDVVQGMEAFAPHIDSLFEKGIMLGDGSGHFLPLDSVNRETLATVVDRAVQYLLAQMGK